MAAEFLVSPPQLARLATACICLANALRRASVKISLFPFVFPAPNPVFATISTQNPTLTVLHVNWSVPPH